MFEFVPFLTVLDYYLQLTVLNPVTFSKCTFILAGLVRFTEMIV